MGRHILPAGSTTAVVSDREGAVDRSLETLRQRTSHLNRAVTLAHHSFGVRYAQLNLVRRGRLVSLAYIGRSSDGLLHSLSGLVVTRDEPLLIADTRTDRRCAAIPETQGSDAIRFYAGHPIHSPDGHRVGALCVLDTEPHDLFPDDGTLLHDVAELVEGELHALTTPPRR